MEMPVYYTRKQLGEEFTRRRLEMGLTVEELVEIMDEIGSTTTINKAENGKPMRLDSINKIARFYKIPEITEYFSPKEP